MEKQEECQYDCSAKYAFASPDTSIITQPQKLFAMVNNGMHLTFPRRVHYLFSTICSSSIAKSVRKQERCFLKKSEEKQI